MSKNRAYTGIDCFRLAAAFLVIAIHTGPLAAYTETGDFILTRVLARTAVPFFLMTSGFFLISRYSRDASRLWAFVRKTALIYALAIALYIPLNLYTGYFTMDSLLPNLIKDLLLDGTVYHLWYLPAAILGALLAWPAVKKLGFPKALLAAVLLYLLGLLGDSYYGLSEKIPALKGLLDAIFQVSDYTRNGIFFAPVFFVMGGMLADGRRTSLKKSLLGFGLSLILMLAEGLLLHRLGWQRHDSMYVSLLPCMYFLFSALIHWKGPRVLWARTAALSLYIIHPLVIVAVRMFAKLLGLQNLLIENSLLHFTAVSLGTAAVSGLAVLILYRLKEGLRPMGPVQTERAWTEINLNHLRHNAKTLERAMPPGCALMAVVKAEAYGHGAFAVSACLEQAGIRAFAVATLDEGIALRRYGIRGQILVLGYTSPGRAKELRRYRLMQTVISAGYADALNQTRIPLRVQIKIDTGMHRLGLAHSDTEGVLRVFQSKYLQVQGIYTHLCVSDSLAQEDVRFTDTQIRRFYGLLDRLTRQGLELPDIHIQNSGGLMNTPALNCDYVRAGIALYGAQSSPQDADWQTLHLKPVLSLRARVVLLRNIPRGETAGYGRGFTAEHDTLLAILPIGYADGLPRSLSCGTGEAVIRGQRAPVAGRICMDQLAVDVTAIPGVAVGDIATLIGRDGQEELSAAEAASRAGTISNELLSRLGTRLEHVTVSNGS